VLATVVLVVAWLALACAVVALVARQFAWTWQPLVVTASFAHQLLWAAPVAVLCFALGRKWAAVLVALAVLVLAGVSQAGLYVGRTQDTGTQLRVLQANLRLGAADPDALVRAVRDERVDVAFTEELTPGERDRLLAAGLGRQLPFRFDAAAPGGTGLAIWSRLPLTDEVRHGGFPLGVLTATVQVASTPVTVVAVHLSPPYPHPTADWAAETARLRGLLRDLPGGQPVLVAGDFNATTDNAQYRRLLGAGYADAAAQTGAGYLPTYPADRWYGPVLAIDHLLTRAASVAELRALTLPGSDHRGLFATVLV
jgi:endonuclease/exonuclease/phosphatase (EEP) superfamily protein YafD